MSFPEPISQNPIPNFLEQPADPAEFKLNNNNKFFGRCITFKMNLGAMNLGALIKGNEQIKVVDLANYYEWKSFKNAMPEDHSSSPILYLMGRVRVVIECQDQRRWLDQKLEIIKESQTGLSALLYLNKNSKESENPEKFQELRLDLLPLPNEKRTVTAFVNKLCVREQPFEPFEMKNARLFFQIQAWLNGEKYGKTNYSEISIRRNKDTAKRKKQLEAIKNNETLKTENKELKNRNIQLTKINLDLQVENKRLKEELDLQDKKRKKEESEEKALEEDQTTLMQILFEGENRFLKRRKIDF